jgi:hypothetical protein
MVVGGIKGAVGDVADRRTGFDAAALSGLEVTAAIKPATTATASTVR